MSQIKALFFVLLTFAFMSGLIIGCGSSPSEEEMKQLNDLKAEVEKLQGDVNKLDSEKSDLQKQIAAQDVIIKDYNSKATAVRNCK